MIFDWKWRYEIAPMYMKVLAKPYTKSKDYEFKVMCGITSNATYSGSRLPMVGEQIYFPEFNRNLVVTSLRSWGFNSRQKFSRKNLVDVYIDPKQLGDEDFWNIGIDRMKPVQSWSWSTNYLHHNYTNFGYTPSDWADPKLKFAEREYVLSWTKHGTEFIAKDGRIFSRLDPKHHYLKDWFPEVGHHLDKQFWKT